MIYDYDRSKVAAASRLDNGTKSKINADLRKAGLDGNGRFRKIGEAISKALTVLSRYGIEQDDYLNAHNFPEAKGSYNIGLAFSNKEDPFSPTSIANTGLYLAWEDLGRNVEVVGYLS